MIQQAIDKEALKQQQFFTEVLAHDLKTPTLAQLRGLELIQNEIVGKIDIKDYFDTINHEKLLKRMQM